jgi:hypothetical protein
MCCRNDINNLTKSTNDNESIAGFWGATNLCDIPLWTVENMFNNIRKNEQVNQINVF